MPTSGTIRQLMPISTQGLYYRPVLPGRLARKRRLTLNLGLRWDLSARRSREVQPDRLLRSVCAQSARAPGPGLPNLTGALRWVGGDNGRNQQETPWHDFGPRVGFALQDHRRAACCAAVTAFSSFLATFKATATARSTAFRDTPMVTSIDDNSPRRTVSAIRSRKACCPRSTIAIRWR